MQAGNTTWINDWLLLLTEKNVFQPDINCTKTTSLFKHSYTEKNLSQFYLTFYLADRRKNSFFLLEKLFAHSYHTVRNFQHHSSNHTSDLNIYLTHKYLLITLLFTHFGFDVSIFMALQMVKICKKKSFRFC